MNPDTIEITYRLRFSLRDELVFRVVLDSRTALVIPETNTQAPEWASLDAHPCDACAQEGHTHCLAALAIVDIANRCRGLDSHAIVTATVLMPDRTVTATITLQEALRSLVGLAIAASGCPDTAMLRPMARFHLPFASHHEALWRSVSNYLLIQYFRKQRGEASGLELDGLRVFYDRLHAVNKNLERRLRSFEVTGANLNALILLDLFAQEFRFSIDDHLSEFASLYEQELDSPPPAH